MIPLKEQEFLRQKFAQELGGSVRIEFFTQRETGLYLPGQEPCQYCKPTRQILEELAGLSGKIDLRTYYLSDHPAEAEEYGIDKAPAIVIRARSGRWFTYYGLPTGNEFPALIDALIVASHGGDALDAQTKKELKRIKQAVYLQVFVTPACPYCPQMAHTVYALALESQHVRAEVVEISEFPQLAQRYQVKAVPTTVIDEKVMVPGAIPARSLIEAVIKVAEGALVTEAGAAGAITPSDQTPGGRIGPAGLIIP